MKKLLTGIATTLPLLVLNIFGLVSHAAAIPMVSYQMPNMSHQVTSSANCATICKTAVMNSKGVTVAEYEAEDDQPIIPFYIQFQELQYANLDTKSGLYASAIKPPSKIPIYILCGVFRS